jgi:hypothetical protein
MSADITPVTFVNLTPHPIRLPDRTIPTSGEIARCHEYTAAELDLDGVPAVRRGYGAVLGLPDPCAGTVFIVSMIVRLLLPGRLDLASPGELRHDVPGARPIAQYLVLNPA